MPSLSGSTSKLQNKDAPKGQAKHQSRKAPIKATKPLGLSEERVVESDSDRESSLPKATVVSHSRKQNGAPIPNLKATPTSSQSGTSSSSESESPGTEKVADSREKVNDVERKRESGSNGGREQADSVQHARKRTKLGQETESDEASTSSGAEAGAHEEVGTQEQNRSPSAAAITPTAQSIPAPPFRPPNGYTPVKLTSLSPNSFMSVESLVGKQIWHISVPSSIPAQSICELSIQAVLHGTATLHHKGMDFLLCNDKSQEAQAQTVLLPCQSGYRLASMKVERTLRLQEKLQLPSIPSLRAGKLTGSKAAGDVSRSAVSSIQSQPKGLRMRYKPPGFGSGDAGVGSESEAESGTTTGGLQFPAALGVHGAEHGGNGDETQESQKKKRKSKLKEGDTLTTTETQPLSSQNAAQVTNTKTTTRLQDDTPLSVMNGEKKESKEERRKRKEERRLRKEAKNTRKMSE